MSKYVFALRDTLVVETGVAHRTRVTLGSVWHADAPFVKANPGLFSPDPPVVYPRDWAAPAEVEQATAAPGEKRSTRRKGDAAGNADA